MWSLKLKFKDKYLFNYVQNAPVALATERSLECHIMSSLEFVRPILDVGCGDGLFASILFDEQIDVGVDSNGEEIKRAKEKNSFNELISCAAHSIPKDSGFFNTIYANSTLEHITELKPTLQEIYRLLSSKGQVYLTLPTDLFEQYTLISQFLTLIGLKAAAQKYQKMFNRFWRHHHCYPKEQWEEIFKGEGFEIVKASEYAGKRICLINDFMLIFALPSVITKKLFGRRILSPGFRKIVLFPLYCLIEKIIKSSENRSPGGLFFSP